MRFLINFVVYSFMIMSRTWLVDSRDLAKKIINPSESITYQTIEDSVDNSNVTLELPGLPAGVKFDPSDMQLLEHLTAKCGVQGSVPHMTVDDFISTLDQGICYTHPENLPGVKEDGSCVHFFHKTINAYASGQRKRRKIQNELGGTSESVRWHKTGKTKPVIENGVLKGWKKIMVLYTSSTKDAKQDKSNWVMHQYHIGSEEEEKEGEYVVSKIMFHPPKQVEMNQTSLVIENPLLDTWTNLTSPRTPNIPDPPRKEKSVLLYDDVSEDTKPVLFAQDACLIKKISNATPSAAGHQYEVISNQPALFAGESRAAENANPNGVGDALLCNDYQALNFPAPYNYSDQDHLFSSSNACPVADIENLELDTPPDFHLPDLQFSSQDSVFDWLDRPW